MACRTPGDVAGEVPSRVGAKREWRERAPGVWKRNCHSYVGTHGKKIK